MMTKKKAKKAAEEVSQTEQTPQEETQPTAEAEVEVEVQVEAEAKKEVVTKKVGTPAIGFIGDHRARIKKG